MYLKSVEPRYFDCKLATDCSSGLYTPVEVEGRSVLIGRPNTLNFMNSCQPLYIKLTQLLPLKQVFFLLPDENCQGIEDIQLIGKSICPTTI